MRSFLAWLAAERLPADPRAADVRLPANRDEWELWCETADFHGLSPLAHLRLREQLEAAVPAAIAARLEKRHRESMMRGLVLAARLGYVVAAFKSAAIPVVSLKGPALAELLYGDVALRPSFDLDLLVQRSDAARALALLGELGFSLPAYLQRLPLRRLMSIDCEASLTAADGVTVELHWDLMTPDYPFQLDASLLWASVREQPVAGQAVPVFTAEFQLLYLCVHGAKHAWARLLGISDVARLLRRGLDWEEVERLAAASGCGRLLDLGCAVAHDVFDVEIPTALAARAAADAAVSQARERVVKRLDEHTPSAPSALATTAFGASLARTRWAAAKHYAAMFVVPRTDDLERVTLPEALFWLHAPMRVQRLIAKHGLRGRAGSA